MALLQMSSDLGGWLAMVLPSRGEAQKRNGAVVTESGFRRKWAARWPGMDHSAHVWVMSLVVVWVVSGLC